MVSEFVDAFMQHKATMREHFAAKFPANYDAIVREVVKCVNGYQAPEHPASGGVPDPERIHAIDDGTYQGTRLYVVGECGSDPSAYWFARIGYGTCALCDTFQRIEWNEEDPEQQLDDLMTLALHVVQALRPLDDGWVRGVE